MVNAVSRHKSRFAIDGEKAAAVRQLFRCREGRLCNYIWRTSRGALGTIAAVKIRTHAFTCIYATRMAPRPSSRVSSAPATINAGDNKNAVTRSSYDGFLSSLVFLPSCRYWKVVLRKHLPRLEVKAEVRRSQTSRMRFQNDKFASWISTSHLLLGKSWTRAIQCLDFVTRSFGGGLLHAENKYTIDLLHTHIHYRAAKGTCWPIAVFALPIFPGMSVYDLI